MKRFFVLALSLSLLLVMTGLTSGASLTVNLVGKFEGTVSAVQDQSFIKKTSMILRIAAQDGALFYGSMSFPEQPNWNDGNPVNFNGVVDEGRLYLTGSQVVAGARFQPTVPPQLSGNLQHFPFDSQDKTVTGVFFLKRTSTNPSAP